MFLIGENFVYPADGFYGRIFRVANFPNCTQNRQQLLLRSCRGSKRLNFFIFLNHFLIYFAKNIVYFK